MGLSLPPSLPHGERHVPRRDRLMKAAKLLFFAAVLVICGTSVAAAQPPSSGTTPYTQYGEPPVMDNTIFYHVLFNQLEGRTNGPDNEFRWDGEGWIGANVNKLWFKSEGFVEHGRMTTAIRKCSTIAQYSA